MSLHALVAGLTLACASPQSDEGQWPIPIGAEHRPGTYFWVPGNAWDRDGIEHNLTRLQAAGYGTVHLVPVYPSRSEAHPRQAYLGERWGEHFERFVRRAQALGLQVDMTTGTGWCFGGPGLGPEQVDSGPRWDPENRRVVGKPGRRVKRAAPGGEGMMLDSFQPAAMERHLERFEAFFSAYQGSLPRAQYHDSYEYVGNWSTVMPDAFLRRRGYDLEPFLEDLYGGGKTHDSETLRRVRQDLNRTFSEQHLATMQVWNDWVRRRGMITRNQAHGAPANLLDLYAQADIPETEVFRSPPQLDHLPGYLTGEGTASSDQAYPANIQLAASAAHVVHPPGAQLVSMEAFTWLREHWHASLHQLRLAVDLYFTHGVNQMFYHGFCYSPRDLPWPGWYFYASTQANDRNPIWRDIRTLNDYIARCQSVLQGGRPDQDVLVYWPIEDIWDEHLTPHFHVASNALIDSAASSTMARLRMAGITGDYVSDAMLAQLSADEGRILAPGGDYRALVVPSCRFLPLSSLEQIRRLQQHSARIIFVGESPTSVPGLAEARVRQERFDVMIEEAKSAADSCSLEVLGPKLHELVPGEAGLVSAGCAWIRRKHEAGRDYFLVNHNATAIDASVRLAHAGSRVALLDPMTSKAGSVVANDGRVRLQLAAGQSIVVRTGSQGLGTMSEWNYRTLDDAAAHTLKGWRASFGKPVYGARPPELTWKSHPEPWTDSPAHSHFAGTSYYQCEFEHEAGRSDSQWTLRCGEVAGSVQVLVNGAYVRTLLGPPYQCDVGAFLREGHNTLRLEVTSVAANAVRAMARDGRALESMGDINIVNRHYRPFRPADWPVRPAGLAGPVRLVPQKP